MAIATVGIVGRPNVGKSTLFNKLTGKRLSITEDTPGVTRDRLYSKVEWQNKNFILIDTGGLEPKSEDPFAKHIATQVEIAVDNADLILFLVDGKDGITSVDRQIASLLRKSNKKCMVVVNKIDKGNIPVEVYEFYELGFESLEIISAEQGLGIGDLLDRIFEELPDDASVNEDMDSLPIALLGKPNVGKSSLVNTLLDENRVIVSDIAGTTRDSIDSYYERNGKKYTIIDTAGLRRPRSVNSLIEKYSVIRTYNAVDRADICLFMIDASVGITEQDARIIGYAHDNGKASIFVVNKWDLVEKETNTQRDFENNLRNQFSFMQYAPVVFISVKLKLRIDKLFEIIDKVDENYSFRVSTGTLNQIIRDAVVLNPPPTDKGKRLKIYYAQQVTTRPPKFLIHVNDKNLCHFSYIRYLENKLRENFPFDGTPITIEVRQKERG